jgi:hypothetical protein
LRHRPIDCYHSLGVGEQEPHPRHDGFPTNSSQHVEDEAAVYCVVRLPDVKVDHRAVGGETLIVAALRVKSSREHLHCEDVVANITGWQKALLFLPHDPVQRSPQPAGQHFGQDPIVSVEEGDGSVVAELGAVHHHALPVLEQCNNGAIKEALWYAFLQANGTTETDQEGLQSPVSNFVDLRRQSIRPWG